MIYFAKTVTVEHRDVKHDTINNLNDKRKKRIFDKFPLKFLIKKLDNKSKT